MEQFMEFTREIYWNVGSGAGTLIPMYLLLLVAVSLLAWGGWQRIKVYRLGRELQRCDDLPRRLVEALGQVLTQVRVLRVTGAGTAHGLFFWGFFLLFIGTSLIVLQADFTDPLFGIKFLKGNFYLIFSLVLDLAGAVAIVMLAGLFVRRYFVRPAGLETCWEDAVSHVLLMVILLTGFVIEGARMAVTELGTDLALWSPVGLIFAKSLAGIGEESQRALHAGLWWLHLLLALGFVALLPFTKLRHILTTSANYIFIDRGPKGGLVTLDMEDGQALDTEPLRPVGATGKSHPERVAVDLDVIHRRHHLLTRKLPFHQHQVAPHIDELGNMLDRRRTDLLTGAAGGTTPDFGLADRFGEAGIWRIEGELLQLIDHLHRRQRLFRRIRRTAILTPFAEGTGVGIENIFPGQIGQVCRAEAFRFLVLHIERHQPTFGTSVDKYIIGAGRQDVP